MKISTIGRLICCGVVALFISASALAETSLPTECGDAGLMVADNQTTVPNAGDEKITDECDEEAQNQNVEPSEENNEKKAE